MSNFDFSELFQKVSNGERTLDEWVKDSITKFLSTFQDNEDMFINEYNAMYVQHIAVDEFEMKLDSIYWSTKSQSQLCSIHDNN